MPTTISGYTTGCIDSSSGTKLLLDQESIDLAYRQDDGHVTRSTAHSVFKNGGLGQEMLDSGERLFTGNQATDFGSLVDGAIPMLVCGVDWESRYVSPPDEVLSNGARRGKAYTEWKDSIGNAMEISRSDAWKLRHIVANVMGNRAAREIIEATEDCQAAFRHTDAAGHKRKALADGVTPDYLWDFKTTSSTWSQLYRSCIDYGYLWQAAWYVDAAMACGWPDHQLKFVFAQSTPPFAVRVYTLPEDLVQRARLEIAVTLDQMALRRELGVYRSAEDEEEMELEFPAWTRGGQR